MINRRAALKTFGAAGAGIVGTGSVFSTAGYAKGKTSNKGTTDNNTVVATGSSLDENVGLAYQHLDLASDEFKNSSGKYIPRSFMEGQLEDYHTGHTYDLALVILAYIARGSNTDLLRASVIGKTIIEAQNNDPAGDGRVRTGYDASELFSADGVPSISSHGSYMGNISWIGLALAKLYEKTRTKAFLNAAVKLGNFSEQFKDAKGAGGFRGGLDSNEKLITWKSTEHNIDAAAFFNQLYKVTKTKKWLNNSTHAKKFVEKMWDGQKFVVGTLNDGVSLNTGDNPVLDVQSWGYMLFEDVKYASALDWVRENLETVDSKYNIRGVKYADGENPVGTIWLEGNCQIALAMLNNGSEKNVATAEEYLQSVVYMQLNGENTNGKGIISAPQQGTAGGGDEYYQSLHIGTTAWFVMAGLKYNPLSLN